MKRIVYVSEESMVAGNGRCGIADVVDGLSNSCAQLYDVCVITQDYGGYITRKVPVTEFMDGVRTMKILGAHYYLIDAEHWDELVVKIIDALNPDILHNFASPNILDRLAVIPAVSVYTIDHAKYVRGKEDDLKSYTTITTVSEAYAEEILRTNDTLAQYLRDIDFRGITNGIVDSIFNPATGFFLLKKYTPLHLDGKTTCKQYVKQIFKLDNDVPIFVSIARLASEKGVEDLLANAKYIKERGGVLIVYGRGEPKFVEQAAQLHKNGDLIFVHSSPSLMRMIPILAGADFYLSPSKEEPCGLMPMMASRYGVIPITTLTGGLKDNFNSLNAIVIDGDLQKAIDEAFALMTNPVNFQFMRSMIMTRNFSWKKRKEKYIDIYEQEHKGDDSNG